jgi:hypothetical protein
MSATTKDKLQFVHAMARHTSATVRQCEALMRYGATYRKVLEWERCEPHKLTQYQDKRLRIANKIGRVCEEITGTRPVPFTKTLDIHAACLPVFNGAAITVRVPGGEEICVPS